MVSAGESTQIGCLGPDEVFGDTHRELSPHCVPKYVHVPEDLINTHCDECSFKQSPVLNNQPDDNLEHAEVASPTDFIEGHEPILPDSGSYHQDEVESEEGSDVGMVVDGYMIGDVVCGDDEAGGEEDECVGEGEDGMLPGVLGVVGVGVIECPLDGLHELSTNIIRRVHDN